MSKSTQDPTRHQSNKETVHSIINKHGKEITAIPNVVGVYAGLLEDQQTECIKVLVTKKDQETERLIYNAVKGVPVTIEQTGNIAPLNAPGDAAPARK